MKSLNYRTGFSNIIPAKMTSQSGSMPGFLPDRPVVQIPQVEDFNNLDEVRSYIYEAISDFRISKGRSIIARFEKDKFDEYLKFSRIGEGSIGGKPAAGFY